MINADAFNASTNENATTQRSLYFSMDAACFRGWANRLRILSTKYGLGSASFIAEELSKKNKSYLISPYDHPEVITGQGTIGVEIMDEMEPLAVFVPVGGGGLIAGIAHAIKQKMPHVQIIGVEPEMEDDACLSFHSGVLQSHRGESSTIADAIKIPQLGNLTFPLIQKYVDDMITVTEEEIKAALTLTLERAHLVAEPAGALALAGALKYPFRSQSTQAVVAICSGGNSTFKTLQHILNP